MFVDRNGDGNNRTWLDIAQFRTCAPIYDAGRQVEKQIDDSRRIATEQTRIDLLKFRSNTGKAGDGCKQGVENERTHPIIIAKFSVVCAVLGCPCVAHALHFHMDRRLLPGAHGRPMTNLQVLSI